MAEESRLTMIRRVCPRAALAEGGRAVGFSIKRGGNSLPAFAIAYDETVHAYVNICPHRGTSLDWQPGEVFDESGLYLICATHGALFEPATGQCIAGPCQGAQLPKIAVKQEGVHVVLVHDILADFQGD